MKKQRRFMERLYKDDEKQIQLIIIKVKYNFSGQDARTTRFLFLSLISVPHHIGNCCI
jgi:hypothetical protein